MKIPLIHLMVLRIRETARIMQEIQRTEIQEEQDNLRLRERAVLQHSKVQRQQIFQRAVQKQNPANTVQM